MSQLLSVLIILTIFCQKSVFGEDDNQLKTSGNVSKDNNMVVLHLDDNMNRILFDLFVEVFGSNPSDKIEVPVSTVADIYRNYTREQLDSLKAELRKLDNRFEGIVRKRVESLNEKFLISNIEYALTKNLTNYEQNFIQIGEQVVTLQKLVLKLTNADLPILENTLPPVRTGRKSMITAVFDRLAGLLLGVNNEKSNSQQNDEPLNQNRLNRISALMRALQSVKNVSTLQLNPKMQTDLVKLQTMLHRLQQIQLLSRLAEQRKFLASSNMNPYGYEAILNLVKIVGTGSGQNQLRALMRLFTAPQTMTNVKNRNNVSQDKLRVLMKVVEEQEKQRRQQQETQRHKELLNELLANQRRQQQQIDALIRLIETQNKNHKNSNNNDNRGNHNQDNHNNQNQSNNNQDNHNQGHHNQGHHNQGHHNQGNHNQESHNNWNNNQGNQKPINQGNHNQGNQGHHNQGNHNNWNNNQGNQKPVNQGNHNQGNHNQETQNQGNQGHPNQGSHNNWNNNQGNQKPINQGNHNRETQNQGSQGHHNQGSHNNWNNNQGNHNQESHNNWNNNQGNQKPTNQGHHNQGNNNKETNNNGNHNLESHDHWNTSQEANNQGNDDQDNEYHWNNNQENHNNNNNGNRNNWNSVKMTTTERPTLTPTPSSNQNEVLEKLREQRRQLNNLLKSLGSDFNNVSPNNNNRQKPTQSPSSNTGGQKTGDNFSKTQTDFNNILKSIGPMIGMLTKSGAITPNQSQYTKNSLSELLNQNNFKDKIQFDSYKSKASKFIDLLGSLLNI